MQRTRHLAVLFVLTGLMLAGCGKPEDPGQSSETGPWPDGLFARSAPSGTIRGVADVVATGEDGEEVLVRAYVGGRRDPFVSGFAVMTVTDADAPHCHQTADDGCSTPWDFCCVPRELLAGKTIAVQVAGDDGRPLRRSLRDAPGLKPLKVVLVRGFVRRAPEGTPPALDARSIFIEE